MATRLSNRTTFEPEHVIQPVFTGGSVSLDNDASILATSLGEDVVLTDLSTGRRLAFIEGDGEQITTLILTPSASHLIVCSRSLSMRIYSLKTQEGSETVDTSLLRTLKPHGTPAVVLAVDRTSTLLATGSADGAIKVWDISGGYVTHTFRGPSVLVSALHFFEVAASRNQKQGNEKRRGKLTNGAEGDGDNTTSNFRLASGSQDGKVRIWDLHKRTTVANLDSHVSSVQAIAYSADEHTLVTGSRDRTLMWWDVRSWKIMRTTPTHEQIEAAGFLEDGRVTYSAGEKGCLRLFETNTGRELTREQPTKGESDGITAALALPNQHLILSVQVDHTLALYKTPSIGDTAVVDDLEPLQPFRRISGTHDEIIDLAYALPDKSLLVLVTNSESVRILSVTDTEAGGGAADRSATYFGQDVALLAGHDGIVLSLDIDWSGYWIATCSKDNTARLWKIDQANDSYSCYATFTGHAESVGAVALSRTIPDESSAAYTNPLEHPPSFLLSGSMDQTIKKWEIPRQSQQESGKPSRALFTRKAHDKDINAIDINQSGLLFASASQDKTVKIWDTKAGEVQGILKGHRRGVWSVRFAPTDLPAIQGEQGSVSGKGVILTASGDKTVKLWNLSDYTCIKTFEGHSESVLKVAWLNIPAGDDSAKKRVLFASAGRDGLVKVWDANLGETECTLDNHEDKIWALTVHPKTNTIVSGSADSTVTFWKDTTAETQAAATEEAFKLVEQEQELQNHIHAGSYREAIVLALQLNHPGRLLSLFTNVVTTNNPEKASLSGLKAVDEVLGSLSDEQIFLLLLRLRDWNTNARTAPVAQRVLWTLVRSYPASKFSSLSVKGARGQKSLKEVLNALKVYTERHYKRMEELVDESYLVEYTLQEMDTLAPSLDQDLVMADV